MVGGWSVKMRWRGDTCFLRFVRYGSLHARCFEAARLGSEAMNVVN